VNKAQLATLLSVGFAVAFIGWAVVYLASFPSHPDKDDPLATRGQFRSWLSAKASVTDGPRAKTGSRLTTCWSLRLA
jgi:hypothetical protein